MVWVIRRICCEIYLISTLQSPYSYITSYTKQYAPEVGDGLKLSAPISAMLFGMGFGRVSHPRPIFL
jgi:hypothetical protein